jgi:nucleoside-diphosphate-sugar epimerase
MILVTGANGFVGQALCTEAVLRGMAVRGVTRGSCNLPYGVENFTVGSIDGNNDWLDVLTGCEVVVHLAARVHVMADRADNPLEEFRRINVQGTLNLARHAAESGVRRFLFISSVGVNGAETFHRPFISADTVAPHSPYAVSKYEAELGLQALAVETGMEVVIIRPPLVYGPGAPGNFGSLMRWISLDLPFPFGLVTTNRRSLVGLDNLVDLILTCVHNPNAANQTFLVSDGDDLSTAELLRRIGKSLSRPARLIPVPVSILNIAFSLLGKSAVAHSLLGSLQLDITKTCEVLDWKPPVSVDEGLRRAAQQRL